MCIAGISKPHMSGIFSKNLKKISGLDIEIKNSALEKGASIEGGARTERTVESLNPVLFESRPGEKRVVYYVWRELHKKENAEATQKLRVRYDITAMDPSPIGRELPKTFGHYHAKDMGGIGYPEIYEVLSGIAWWIIQKPAKNDPRTIEETYLIEAHEGEKAVMPPNFGHISINPGPKPLIMANWIGNFFKYDYDTYENLHGACWFALNSESGDAVEFEKNSFYYTVPELAKLRPRDVSELGISKKIPLYTLIAKPEFLNFLSNPRSYLKSLTIENCFRKK